ncbi:MAG: glutamate synthase subunit alpha, partial [Chloroflexi bacterium]|nr:glutamate synthase subunit alpha [Chloroflexota bacterium]
MPEEPMIQLPPLYNPAFERAACGVGFIADVSGAQRHAILQLAIQAVVNLTHRGAVSADGKSGDGAGILTQVPIKLMNRELAPRGLLVGKDGDLGVGMFFFPQVASAREACLRSASDALKAEGLEVAVWRQVPLDTTALGAKALQTMPDIRQALVLRPPAMAEEAFRRALYLARKGMEARVREAGVADFYLPSFSNRTLVYKGLLVAPQLARLYRDLEDPSYETCLAVFHQRYSTNTFPNWFLAQPFRFLGHNGEINTLQGTANWMRAREPELASAAWGQRVRDLTPVIQPGGSDSAQLDNVLEALVLSGRDVLHTVCMLIPEAWENMPDLDPRWRAFYEYHACLTEPWDGPAALAFSDGILAGGALDRNGLRPARYKISQDGIVTMASEVGVLELDDKRIVEKGRLGPGQMLAVDTVAHRILKNADIKDALADRRPYGEWVRRHLFSLPGYIKQVDGSPLPEANPDPQLQRVFCYTSEELNLLLTPLVAEAKEPVGAMGDDTPLAVLSTKPRLLYTYFKQRFAQVTNPPIDYLREHIVMALHTYMGPRRSLLEESPEHALLVFNPSPVLLDHELEALRNLPSPTFQSVTIPCLFPVAPGAEALEPALREVCRKALEAVSSGASIIILSDKG